MTPDPILYIIAAALIGSGLGFILCGLLAARKIHRLEKETWAAANTYYQRRYHPTERRL
jgi:hypothetical protein